MAYTLLLDLRPSPAAQASPLSPPCCPPILPLPLALSLGMCICCSLVWGALPPSAMSTFDLLPLLLFSQALVTISGAASESHWELEGGTGQGLCLTRSCQPASKTVLGNELDQSLGTHVRFWPGVGTPAGSLTGPSSQSHGADRHIA